MSTHIYNQKFFNHGLSSFVAEIRRLLEPTAIFLFGRFIFLFGGPVRRHSFIQNQVNCMNSSRFLRRLSGNDSCPVSIFWQLQVAGGEGKEFGAKTWVPNQSVAH